MKLDRRTSFLLLILIGILFVSCSLERKIAGNYVRNVDKKSIMLFFPDYIQKTNLKTDSIPNADSLDAFTLDSILYAQSIYLQYVDDSLLLSRCKESLIKELILYGFNVYEIDRMDEFIALNDSSYVLNLAQIELEEYLYIFSPEYHLDERNFYTVNIGVNAINLNSWFELDRHNIPSEQYPVLYSSYYLHDEVKGDFIKKMEKGTGLTYKYKIDSVNVVDVYELAALSGKKYAINLYDYLLNLYIQDNMPKGQVPVAYFHYERKSKMISTIYEDSFIEIDPKE